MRHVCRWVRGLPELHRRLRRLAELQRPCHCGSAEPVPAGFLQPRKTVLSRRPPSSSHVCLSLCPPLCGQRMRRVCEHEHHHKYRAALPQLCPNPHEVSVKQFLGNESLGDTVAHMCHAHGISLFPPTALNPTASTASEGTAPNSWRPARRGFCVARRGDGDGDGGDGDGVQRRHGGRFCSNSGIPGLSNGPLGFVAGAMHDVRCW